MKKKFNLGFTLIELLVVIAIISLLSSIVLANVVKARQKAEAISDIATLRQIGNALNLYFNQYGRYPDATPGIADPNQTIAPGSAGTFYSSNMVTYGTCIGVAPCGIEILGSISQNNTILTQITPYFSSARTLKGHSFMASTPAGPTAITGFWYGCYEKDSAGNCVSGKLSAYIIGNYTCPSLGAPLDIGTGYHNAYVPGGYTNCEYMFGK